MARVSKNNLNPKQKAELESQLTEVIGKMNTNLAQYFISEFFGPEERIMLAKRLAILALIHEQRPIHRISTYLHTSETTVANLRKRYANDEFTNTIKALTKNKATYIQFIDLLDSILTVGGIMPHRNSHIKLPR